MASKAPRLGGYDLKFVNEPPDALMCLICQCIAKDPQQMDCCGRVYCKVCMSEHRKVSRKCPNCRETSNSFVDKKSDRDIKALKVKCNNLDNGCEWIGELRCLQEHLLVCGYITIPCTNECKHGEEVLTLLLKDLNGHLTNSCPRRQYECPHCHESGEYEERAGEHLETCPGVLISCTNIRCSSTFSRSQALVHLLLECSYEPVPCKYADIGCEERPLREDLKKHEEDDQLHLRITTENILKQKKEAERLGAELKELEEEVQQLSQQIKNLKEETNKRIGSLQSPFSFKVSSFNAKKEHNEVYYSPPFYSSKTGYKLCIAVRAFGYAAGRETHVSVFVYLMKGENDDSLIWPFNGMVTVELLNQLEDKNHHRLTATFTAAQEAACGRVMNGKRAENGWGFPQLISHAELFAHKPKKNCQYLKDDTLVFRVAVQVPDYKHWLECSD